MQIIEAKAGLFSLDLPALWRYRDLLYFLVWRDVKVRYKQTLVGAGWALLQPLFTVAIFTVVFSYFARIPSDGIPYPLFAYVALLPWNYFSQALGRCSSSMVGNAGIIQKIYFPRLIIPVSSVAVPIVDMAISFSLLFAMMAWFGVRPGWGVLALPLFVLLTIATSLATGLWLSAFNVKYRDAGYVVPFLIQFWMYATPIIYPLSLVPEKWRVLYSINPMVGVVEGFRWALLGKQHPDLTAMFISVVIVLTLLLGGIAYFRRVERTFADVI